MDRQAGRQVGLDPNLEWSGVEWRGSGKGGVEWNVYTIYLSIDLFMTFGMRM